LSEKNKIGLFDDSGHLTDEAIALCVEAMMSSAGKNKLPENIKTHLTQCDICNDRVIDLYRDVKDEPEVIRRIQIQSGRAKKNILFSSFSYKYSIAAVVLVLVAVGSYLLFQPPSAEKLFRENFEPYPNILAMKSEVKNDLSTALLYYELKDWDSAILLFQNVLKNEQTNSGAMFYLGNAYLAKGDSDKAIYWLRKTYDVESGLSDQINWYLALAYLQNKDTKTARSHLENLTEKENFYSEKARKLLKKLR
jgi:tetratricopeptide (TPR) repeat protein